MEKVTPTSDRRRGDGAAADEQTEQNEMMRRSSLSHRKDTGVMTASEKCKTTYKKKDACIF